MRLFTSDGFLRLAVTKGDQQGALAKSAGCPFCCAEFRRELGRAARDGLCPNPAEVVSFFCERT